MAEVRVQDGESVENALRRFKRKVQTEDIIKEVKRHSFYLKPAKKNESSKPWLASGAEKSSAETPSRADDNRTALITLRATRWALARISHQDAGDIIIDRAFCKIRQ